MTTITVWQGDEKHDLPLGEQYPPEIAWLLNLISGTQARSVLEIGSRHGYTLRMLAMACGSGSKVRSIDIASETNDELQRTVTDMAGHGFDAAAYIGDSCSDGALAWAEQNGPYDLLFIDGDHDYEGVRKDWERYRHLCKKLIAFHDIDHPVHGVKKLWNQIKAAGFYRTEETTDSRSCYMHPLGIGVVHVKRPAFPDNAPIMVTNISDRLLQELQSLVRFFFCRPVADYVAMEAEQYRALVARAQNEMNARAIPLRLSKEVEGLIKHILVTNQVCLQIVRLRAVRPRVKKIQEYVGWHRESFYGSPQGAINCWMPIANVCTDTALQYIKGSELIADTDIETVDHVDSNITRSSPGFKIGLLDVEKRIVGGVDLTQPQPLIVLPGEIALFDGALIHGSGQNTSDEIRFSIDFRAVANESEMLKELETRRKGRQRGRAQSKHRDHGKARLSYQPETK